MLLGPKVHLAQQPVSKMTTQYSVHSFQFNLSYVLNVASIQWDSGE